MRPDISFFVRCIPPKVTSQQKGVFSLGLGKGVRFFKKKAVLDSEKILSALFIPHRPAKPLEGPITVSICWMFPYRKGEPKARRGLGIPCDVRPDLDNLNKTTCDVLQKLAFFKDDGQISALFLEKKWQEPSGISVCIGGIKS